MQSAGNVWSTNDAQATNSQFTLSLGGTFDVTTIRLWPRADTCCTERWRNLEIQLLDADQNPIDGTLNLATDPGGNVPLEFTFDFASPVTGEDNENGGVGDGMDDGWEVAVGLDPTIDDSGLNPDNDGLTNDSVAFNSIQLC